MTEIPVSPMQGRPQPGRDDVLGSDRLRILSDPLAAVLLGRIRDRSASSTEFCALSEQIANRVLWTALDDVALGTSDVIGFDGRVIQVPALAERVAGIVILRAGLLFAPPFRALLPDAPIYQLGVRRDELRLEAQVYTSNLPANVGWADRVVVLDPMIATGSSACCAVEIIRRTHSGHIVIASIIAAPLGIDALLRADAECSIVTATLDDGLNEHGYIVPGLGDAGDRLFGTSNPPG